MSRHSDIAQAVADVITTWKGDAWSAAQVDRVRVLEALETLVSDDSPIRIGVMANEISNDEEDPRGSDMDLIHVDVLVLSQTPGLENEHLDPIDNNVERLRDHLRKFRVATVNGFDFEIDKTWSLTTSYSHDALTRQELWASLLSAQYSVDVDTLPGVPMP